jgi:hypothetical protein
VFQVFANGNKSRESILIERIEYTKGQEFGTFQILWKVQKFQKYEQGSGRRTLDIGQNQNGKNFACHCKWN